MGLKIEDQILSLLLVTILLQVPNVFPINVQPGHIVWAYQLQLSRLHQSPSKNDVDLILVRIWLIASLLAHSARDVRIKMFYNVKKKKFN